MPYVSRAYVLLTHESDDETKQAIIEPIYQLVLTKHALVGHRLILEIHANRWQEATNSFIPDPKQLRSRDITTHEEADTALSIALRFLSS